MTEFGRGKPWVLATIEAHELRKAGAPVWVPAWHISADNMIAGVQRRTPIYFA